MTPINTTVRVADLPEPVRDFLELYLSGTLRVYTICTVHQDGSSHFLRGMGEDVFEGEATAVDVYAIIGCMEDLKHTLLRDMGKEDGDD